jgi:RNA ligase
MAAPMLYAVRAAVSAKYPRSFHLPWSPGGTSDDKRLRDVSALVGAEIVITEKCDGSNLTYTRSSVFSRSHSGPPGHPSFHIAKATHARIAHLLSDGVSVFCEYCYAVHSIAYEALPSYSLVFGVRDPTVPLLFRGVVSTEDELRSLTASLAREPSALGGPREGVVVRRAGQFSDSEFSRSLGKWVRKDHVQTDEHWMHQAIVPQKLAERT